MSSQKLGNSFTHKGVQVEIRALFPETILSKEEQQKMILEITQCVHKHINNIYSSGQTPSQDMEKAIADMQRSGEKLNSLEKTISSPNTKNTIS